MMGEADSTLSRRDALLATAKVVGVTAFAAPVVVGVFSTSAMATGGCNPGTDSDAIQATIVTGSWTTVCNCDDDRDDDDDDDESKGGFSSYSGGSSDEDDDDDDDEKCLGFFVGQGIFTLPKPGGGTLNGSVVITGSGYENTPVNQTTYTVVSPTGHRCSVTFSIAGCDQNGSKLSKGGVPYCVSKCDGVRLTLASVACCPI
jgi:hypothetical protein